MTHPTELFAAYVDGTLSNEERAEVEAHVATCAACRLEVRLAARARAALAALPEEPVPLGVTGPVLDEISGTVRPRRRRGVPSGERAARWLTAAAAAAVVLVVAIVALPNLGDGAGDGDAGTTTEAAGGAGEEAAAGFADLVGGPLYERRDVDLDPGSVQALAQAFTESSERSMQAPAGADLAEEPRLTEALRCIADGAEQRLGAPLKVIDASYEGTPAHIGVFSQGDGGDRTPEAVTIWIVARDDCRILSFAEQRR